MLDDDGDMLTPAWRRVLAHAEVAFRVRRIERWSHSLGLAAEEFGQLDVVPSIIMGFGERAAAALDAAASTPAAVRVFLVSREPPEDLVLGDGLEKVDVGMTVFVTDVTAEGQRVLPWRRFTGQGFDLCIISLRPGGEDTFTNAAGRYVHPVGATSW
ncbi:hypothetical protein HTZ77_24395 [Nonomuraea sp. SMC257]|uniref:Uncharacterized protein n=1 Tax=Nonomuraea montanisoli TaxID=2741721 RepID=A0A7Y6IBQ1_9ACTN|nr:hypothetical protein [Nonomuraea montanisoli]